MNAREVTLEMLQDSGMSMRGVTNSLGKAPGSLNNIVKRNGIPNASTLVRVADVCGYDIIARRRTDGYEIPIDTEE